MSTTQSAIAHRVSPDFSAVGTAHKGRRWKKFADAALKGAVGFWFAVTVFGQLLFAFSVALFYGLTAARGNWHAWNKSMTHGYADGYHVGNTIVAIHLASAVIIILSGTIQLLPRVRQWAPAFHRWNGRVYLVSAFAVSLAGLYMMWFRGTVGGFAQHLAQSFDAVLIMLFAGFALRSALARDFSSHRVWALRLYLVVSASLFIRAAGLLFVFAPVTGPFGFDPALFQGPLLLELGYGQYLVPLLVLELYLRVQARPSALRRMAMASLLFVLTLGLGAGISFATVTNFLPRIKTAFDGRRSIAQALSATIASSGVDAAVRQYQQLRGSDPATFNFEEGELNRLGYELIREKNLDQAVRILQLNADAYPQSGNVYDSLAEAYMDQGNRPAAIAGYRKALEINPKNRNAEQMLHRLGAR